MTDLVLELGGVIVPQHAALDLEQTYEPIGGYTTRRMLSGAGSKQTHWLKLRTTIRGSGWIPAGLDGLDFSAPMELKCIKPRAVTSAANVFTIPAARRSDAGYEPAGRALVDGQWVESSVGMVGNTATVAAVAEATQYQVLYYPQLQVIADPPREVLDASGAAYSWSLNCEEV